MSNYLNAVYTGNSQLPSPPLSPVISVINQLPTSPLSEDSLPLFPTLPCSEEIDLEMEDDDNFDFSEKEVKYLEDFLGIEIERPEEIPSEPSEDEILRNKFLNMMDEGIEINGIMTPYSYAIERIHSIGKNIVSQITDDSILLRVFEKGNDNFDEFWVHPMILSIQSFKFFKLFEEIKENNEKGVVEITIPSLKTFAFVLYYIYTGDKSKFFEIAKYDEIFYEGIMENIEYLEFNTEVY